MPERVDPQPDLNNSIRFDQFRMLPEEMAPQIDEVVSDIIAFHGLTDRRDVRQGLRASASAILANLMVASRLGEDVFVAVPLSDAEYRNSRYSNSGLSRRNIRRSLDYLCREGGGVVEHSGYLNRSTGVGRHTRIALSIQREEMEDQREDHLETSHTGHTAGPLPVTAANTLITSDTFCSPISILPPNLSQEVIRLKDSNKKLVDYEETEETVSMRSNLRRWNEYARNQWADIFLTEERFRSGIALSRSNQNEHGMEAERPRHIELDKRTLYRVFNNSRWDHGGRLYGGWWQLIRSDYRKFITINGNPTVELDYSNMQIAMLYARQGLPLSEDAYTIDGVDEQYRKIIKRTMLQMLNAREDQGIEPPEPEELPPDWSFEDLQGALRTKHSAVSEYFRTGVGLELQKEDAEIALKVMFELGQQDILGLPIHDSFIVMYRHRTALMESMQRAFGERCNQSIDLSQDEVIHRQYSRDGDDNEGRMDEGLMPLWYERMEDNASDPGYGSYFERVHAFRDRMPFTWQLRNAGSPLGWG